MQERLDPGSPGMRREMGRCSIAVMAVVGTSALLALCVLFMVAGLFGEPTWRSVVAGDPQLDVRLFSPEQVHISLGPDETQMVIMWMTNKSTGAAGSVVLLGNASGQYERKIRATEEPTSYTFPGYSSGHFHTVILRDLEPSTKYYYRCGSDLSWSEELSFVTAPKLGTGEVIIGVVGDMGTARASFLLADGIRRSDSQMFWLVGDLSYADGKQHIWDAYGTMIQPFASRIPFMALAGNHERRNAKHSFLPFHIRYSMPSLTSSSGGGSYFYSFNFGPIHFINLDSEHDYSKTSAQYRWLESDLKAVNRHVTPWLIVGWHRPWYNSNSAHQGEAEKMRVSMEELLYQARVDLCITGHVHAYERTYQVFKGRIDPNGPVHITIGTGGTPEGLSRYWLGKPSWSAIQDSRNWGYGRLHVTNATHLNWKFIHDDGPVADEFWLTR